MTHVYELYDMYGNVVHVGETSRNPIIRLKEHTKRQDGKFFGQQITQIIVAEFPTKKEAFDYQCFLQEEYGLPKDSDSASIGGKANKGVKKKCTKKMSEARIGIPMKETARRKLCRTTKEFDNMFYRDFASGKLEGLSQRAIASVYEIERGVVQRLLRNYENNKQINT